jgi:hypothetical protein
MAFFAVSTFLMIGGVGIDKLGTNMYMPYLSIGSGSFILIYGRAPTLGAEELMSRIIALFLEVFSISVLISEWV